MMMASCTVGEGWSAGGESGGMVVMGDMGFDYETWEKSINQEAEDIHHDPHGYIMREGRKSMRDDLPGSFDS